MARYTKDENGNLILTAGGTRTWIVTQAAHDRAVSAGTAPNNCLVAITDDYPTEDGDISFTTTSALTGGSIIAYRRGNVVTITCRGVAATYGTTDTAIATGLPKAIKECYYYSLDVGNTAQRSLVISTKGELKIGLGSVTNLWQTIVYLTDE